MSREAKLRNAPLPAFSLGTRLEHQSEDDDGQCCKCCPGTHQTHDEKRDHLLSPSPATMSPGVRRAVGPPDSAAKTGSLVMLGFTLEDGERFGGLKRMIGFH